MLTIHPQTNRLFRPLRGQLYNFSDVPVAWSLVRKTEKIATDIKNLISQKNGAPTTTLRSYYKDDYQVGLYGQLGSGTSRRDLGNDLLFFLAEQKKTPSDYLSFWAVFEEDDFSEDEFEAALWRELSFLNDKDRSSNETPADIISDRLTGGFHFSFAGGDFFVVGLHSASTRHSRRFSYPTLVFNTLNQFEKLKKLGQYDLIV